MTGVQTCALPILQLAGVFEQHHAVHHGGRHQGPLHFRGAGRPCRHGAHRAGHAGHCSPDPGAGRPAGPAGAAGGGAVHPHHPAPLCPQGAQQRRLCLPHGGLHRRGDLCGQPAPVLLRVHRRLPRLQRGLHPADEACESLGRQNRKSMPPLQKRCLGIAFVLPGPVVQ